MFGQCFRPCSVSTKGKSLAAISIIVKYCVIVFGKDIPEDAVNRKAKIAGKRKAAAMRADKIE